MADAGSPLIWFAIGHLVVGNAMIGLLEAEILTRWFGGRAWPNRAWLIAANYLSAWVGIFALGQFVPAWTQDGFLNLEEVTPRIIMLVVLTYIASVLIEWPFCIAALRSGGRAAKRGLVATVLVNAMSYSVLVSLYFLTSVTSLLTEVQPVPVSQIARLPGARIYYLTHDRVVHRIGLDGSADEVVPLDVSSAGADWLFVCGTGRRRSLVAANLDRQWVVKDALPGWSMTNCGCAEGEFFRFHTVTTEFQPGKRDGWDVTAYGYSPAWGMTCRRRSTSIRFHLGLETPFLRWQILHPTVLPGDQVVFEVGKQIALLDLPTRRIGRIAWGRGPIVTIE